MTKETTQVAEVTQTENMLPADPMVSMIERVAMDPNADLAKLEKMLNMKERLEAKAAETAFSNALALAQSEMPSVAATHINITTKSKFARLRDVYSVCKPIAAKHGFSFNAIPVTGGREGHLNMRWTLRRGSHVESEISEIPIDNKGMKGVLNKTDTHAYGSTTTYGRRYLFCAVFDVAIGEDDDGRNSIALETVSAEQLIILRNLIEETDTDPVKFHMAYGHSNPEHATLEQFQASLFEAARKQLERKRDMANE